MANYIGATRTNYFRIKDESLWKPWIERLHGDDYINDFTKTDDDGTVLHGFGCYGSVYLDDDYDEYWEESVEYYDEDDGEWHEYEVEPFSPIEELQKILSDDDACIVYHCGWEKLRYVCGGVTVITATGIKYADIEQAGLDIARKLLGNDKYRTESTY